MTGAEYFRHLVNSRRENEFVKDMAKIYEGVEQLTAENERLKKQIMAMRNCNNCQHENYDEENNIACGFITCHDYRHWKWDKLGG